MFSDDIVANVHPTRVTLCAPGPTIIETLIVTDTEAATSFPLHVVDVDRTVLVEIVAPRQRSVVRKSITTRISIVFLSQRIPVILIVLKLTNIKLPSFHETRVFRDS